MAVLHNVVFDCRNALELSAYWKEVLGWEYWAQEEGWVSLRPPGEDDAMSVAFGPVPEAKTVKNRLHLDIRPGPGVGWEEERARPRSARRRSSTSRRRTTSWPRGQRVLPAQPEVVQRAPTMMSRQWSRPGVTRCGTRPITAARSRRFGRCKEPDPMRSDPLIPPANPWDEYAEEYVAFNRQRYPEGAGVGGMLALLLDVLGDPDGRRALDAGCGEGLLARLLAARGARVTGIDLSPRLVAMAREQDPAGEIAFRVEDLSEPHPDLEGSFDLIGSYLVLNDVARYREFASTLATLLAPGGRLALAFNNPYSSVVREHITDYFEPDALGTYHGMWQQGIRARYYHRTLEQYLDAFLDAGLSLVKLVDVPDVFGLEWVLPKGSRFPRFMILAFDKP